MNLQEAYNKYTDGTLPVHQFLNEVRQNYQSRNFIANSNSAEDAIKILVAKNLIQKKKS